MTTTITTATSSIVTMATDDVVYVAASGSIIKTSGGAAIQSSSAVPVERASVVIDGLVARLAAPQAGFTAAVIATAYSEGDSGNNSFSIGRTGVIRSNTDGFILRDANDSVDNFGLIDVLGNAIAMDRGGSVINAGSIFATNAVVINGASGVIRNSGEIIAALIAVASQTATAVLTNSGSVVAGMVGLSLDGGAQTLNNSGSITGGSAAVQVTGLNAGRIVSHGLLQATGVTGSALLITASNGLAVDLAGQIAAGAYGVFSDASKGLRVIQSADISAGSTGIRMLAADGLRLNNSGAVGGGTTGMALAGNNAVLDNSGHIRGLAGDGVQLQGAVFTLNNTGQITGALRGVSYTGTSLTGGNLIVDNAAGGLIHGGTVGLSVTYAETPGPTVQARIHNAGEVSGITVGIQISGLPMVLHNSGSIHATNGSAIAVNGEQDINIVNTGDIASGPLFGAAPAIAIDLASVQGGGINLVQNLGRITGSVVMGDQISTVINHGLIAGDVDLGLGNDVYDGRGGEVTGDVVGDAGVDRLTGGAADDALYGGEDADRLRGGAGDDLLQGGTGRDLMTGNAGADSFQFDRAGEVSVRQSQDHITDFESGVDQIVFAFGGDKSFIGASAFGHHAGEIRYLRGAGIIQGDVDGDGMVDFVLVLDNHATLTAADFAL